MHITLLWVAIVLLLAACSRSQPTPTPVPPPTPASTTTGAAPATAPSGAATESTSQEVATLAPTPAATIAATATPLAGRVVLWHSWAQAEGDALAAVLSQLQEAQPGVQVETLFVAPSDLVTSYAEAVASGSGPDLILAPNWWLNDLVEANAVLNLEPLLGGSLETTYWPATVESMRHHGVLYGLPLTYNLVALYVNNALVPPEGIPTDTAALLAAAGITTTSGVGLYATLFHTYWGLPAYGAQLLNEQGLVTLDQSAGAADYLTWLNALNSTPGSYVNSDYGMLLDRFKKGEFAYLIDGPWALAELRTVLGDDLSVTPLPAGPSAPAQPWLYSDGLFVNPTITPEQQILAMNVALFLTGDQAATTWATTGELLPAARNADLSAAPLLQGFAAQAATAVPMPTTPEMEEVWTYGGDMIIKALTGVAEASVIVSETTTLINEANGK
ncbi:MAG: extracellular solute-binding protein [Caldilineaceae bacterium]|nr:extracellular solute-binding protein [Caldilineaceae bacterium]